MKKIVAALALAAMLALCACSSQAASEDTQESSNASSSSQSSSEAAVLAPFETVDIEGNAMDESVFANHKLTLVNIWATFCGPCLNEMPALAEINAEYADQGVQVVGIVADVTRTSSGGYTQDLVDTANELINETGANYTHLLPSDDLDALHLASVNTVPESFFVDSEGNVVSAIYVGSRSKAEWTELVEEALAQVQ